MNIHSWSDLNDLRKKLGWTIQDIKMNLFMLLTGEMMDKLKKKSITISLNEEKDLITIANNGQTLIQNILGSNVDIETLDMIAEFSIIPDQMIQYITNPNTMKWYLDRFPNAVSKIVQGKSILFTPALNIFTVDEILKKKVDPNGHSEDCVTPLHHVIQKANLKELSVNDAKYIIRALLNAGANPKIRNMDGKTPIDLIPKESELLELFLNPLALELIEWAKPIVLDEVPMGSEPEKIFVTLYKFLSYEKILEMETKFESKLCTIRISEHIPFDYAIQNKTSDMDAIIEHVLQKYQ